MLPLGLNLHFSRVHFATLVADAVQAAPKNRVYRAYWQAQKSQNLAEAGLGHGFWGGSETRALRAINEILRKFSRLRRNLYYTIAKLQEDTNFMDRSCISW